MSSIQLEFPTLVRREKLDDRWHYVVRPLFLDGPVGVGRKFDRALRKFLKGVRSEFVRFKTERDGIEDLLWYRFNPEVRHGTFDLDLRVGRRQVAGRFSAAWFDLDGMRYILLPGFDNHLFIARPTETGKIRTAEEVEGAVQALLRAETKRLGDEAPPPESHMTVRREFVHPAQTPVYVGDGAFPFDREEEDLFASLFGSAGDFHGGVEIERVASDLNLLHPDELEEAFGCDALVDRLRHNLFRHPPAPTVLVGPPGAGKTAVLHEAVRRHMGGREEEPFDRMQKVWHLDPNRVIAGMRIVGMWQNRFEAILSFVRDRIAERYDLRRFDALFVDNPVALLRIGKSGQNDMTLSDVLKPYLEKREVQVVLEATPEVWKRVQELDRRFADLFQVIRVPDPPHDQALRILCLHRAKAEHEHDCRIENEALARILELVRTYRQRKVPHAAGVEFLKTLAAKHRYGTVQAAHVDEIFEANTNLNRDLFDRRRSLGEEHLGAYIDARLVGQPEATRCLSDTIHAVKAHLTDPEKPFASLLFIGPTGVGKTEAAKVLAGFMFTDRESLVRFDMNEFVDGGAVQRLIGNLYHPEGQLTGRVRYRPFSVLLFDEIEKAHASVHDLLLQVLGEGRLTDSLGRTVDFSNTVIIMTSNLGATEARDALGFREDAGSRAALYRKSVEDFFRPEFINRIDRIVAFHRLALPDIKRIARLQIERLLRRDGFVRRTTVLNVTDRALDRIAEIGFDPEMGGRALKRSIEKELTAMAAETMISVPSGEPVIFEVFSRRGALYPKITTLHPAEKSVNPLPFPPPEEGRFLSFYERLDAAVEDLVLSLPPIPAPGTESVTEADPDFLLLKDKLRDFRESVSNKVLELREAKRGARAPFHLKRRRTWKNWRRWDPPTYLFRDLYAQLDIREYLETIYNRAEPLHRDSDSDAVADALKVAALSFRLRATLTKRFDTVCVHIRSLVEGAGLEATWTLCRAYRDLARTFDADVEILPAVEKPERWIPEEELAWKAHGEVFLATRGPEFEKFFRPEAGVHLFFQPFGGAVPMQVDVSRIPEGTDSAAFVEARRLARSQWVDTLESGEPIPAEEDPFRPGPVVRLYSLPAGEDKGILTDMRTGTLDRIEVQPIGGGRSGASLPAESLFAWLYSALPVEDRLDLAPPEPGGGEGAPDPAGRVPPPR